jgi:hypothetical protein
MVAIGQVRSADETVRCLILQCLAFLPSEKFYDENGFFQALNDLFGLAIPKYEISYAVDRLLADESLHRSEIGHFLLSKKIAEEIQSSIEQAHMLESQVRSNWEAEIASSYPRLSFNLAWESLRNYLARAFQRHGMQTIALLDPVVENQNHYLDSLSELLEQAIGCFPPDTHQDLKNAVTGFLATSGDYNERASYISQLADGAFNYFSLTIDYDIAEQFRKNLSPLTIFLDTNFLFGILDLDVNPQVAVSNELLNVIKKFGFPFRLVHHEKTEEELLSSIAHYEDLLKSRHWSQDISRAASSSRFLSGVEKKYHKQFAETGVDAATFFRPYKHADVILEERAIEKFIPENERLEERAELINEYMKFLKERGREKSYKLIDHDMTVLDLTRQLRSECKSTLEAGALFLTRDYFLYRFDWESSISTGKLPCTVLPNLFWQILRPYVPSDVDFSRSFAETFAIPEFRTIGSGANEAGSKMLNILASYKNFPEETAARMLSNDLLIDQLRKAESDQVFQELIESAIVEENAELAEEKALLAEQLAKERNDKARVAEQLEISALQLERELTKTTTELQRFKQKDAENSAKVMEIKTDLESEKRLRIKSEEQEYRYKTIVMVILALLSSIIIILGFEFTIYRIPWDWLINHPNSYGIQASIDFFILLGSLGMFLPKYRKWFWIGAAIPVGLGLLQLLGGPRK